MIFQSHIGPIAYTVRGEKSKLACIMIHGVGLNQGMWQAQVDALSPHFQCITLDLLGHGASGSLTKPLEVEQMAHVIDALCETLNIDACVMMGHSLGSWVAQHCAIEYPQRIVGVVNLSGTPIEDRLNPLFVKLFNVSLRLSYFFPAQAMFKYTAQSKAMTKAAQDFALKSMQNIGKKQFLLSVEGMMKATTIKVSSGVQQPMLIAHGDHEMPKFVAKVGKKWHQRVPHSTYFVIPKAGHNGNQDNPEAFNDALLSFLRTLATNG